METLLFNILDSVDSTNNYAMARVHEGLAIHGQAWFAHFQEKGKGQRGKSWLSAPGENLILTVTARPPAVFEISRFHFHALVSLCVLNFLKEECSVAFRVKWPNDIYYGDRKAGGILIENTLQGSEWKWSVIGFGINVNQAVFPGSVPNAVSLKQITGNNFDTVLLARKLHSHLLQSFSKVSASRFALNDLLENYNKELYRKEERVRFRSGSRVFEAIVKRVDEFGHLVVDNGIETTIAFGEVEWVN